MPKSLSISSEQSGFPEYLDFEKLRTAGILHIGRLSGDIWTDHNIHDPGITILEVLCYALTDLGYRTNFDIEDLLAQPKRENNAKEQRKCGEECEGVPKDNNFFRAAEILGNNPLTVLDYRRMLLDIEGVRNAWLEPADAPAVPDCTNSEEKVLVVDLLAKKLQFVACEAFDAGRHQRIVLNGLYKVYLELELQPLAAQRMGQPPVTEDSILHQVRKTLHAHRNFCEDFAEIIVLKPEKIGVCADLELTPDANPTEVLQRLYSAIQEFLFPTMPFYTLQEMLRKEKSPEEIFLGRPPRLNSHGFIDPKDLQDTERRSELHVSDLYQAILKKDPQIRAIQSLHVDSGVTKSGGAEWVLRLNPHKYYPVFSPDFSSINFFKGDIPLTADTARAKMLFENRLANYRKVTLSPKNLDLPIPEGTHHDLSDYVSIQHEFPRVYGITEGGLPRTEPIERRAEARQLQAYLTFYDQLLVNYLAQLSKLRQLFSFDTDTDRKTYFSKTLLDSPYREQIIRFYNENPATQDSPPVPDPDLDFPTGLTIARDPRSEEEILQAGPEARDNIIRDAVRAFRNKTATIVIRPIGTNGTGQYRFLIKNSAGRQLLLGQPKYATSEAAIRAAKAFLLIEIKEEHFRKTDEDRLQPNGEYLHHHSFRLAFQPDDYPTRLQRIVEDQDTYHRRRNKFLDHLLGRFAEQFTDYVLLMYALDRERRPEADIIADKERFLRRYPKISRCRGQGFDYTSLQLDLPDIEIGPEAEQASQIVEITEKDDARFQLVDLTASLPLPLLVSYRTDYTPAYAEYLCEHLLNAFAKGDTSEYVVTTLEDPEPGLTGLAILRLLYDNEGEVTYREIFAVEPEIEDFDPIGAELIQLEDATEDERRIATLVDKLERGDLTFEVKMVENVSGLKRRVAALMGLNEWNHRTLSYFNTKDLREKHTYHYQLYDLDNDSVLFESYKKDFPEQEARDKGKDILDRLQANWENGRYQVQPLPYDFTSTDQIFGIGVVEQPNSDAPKLIAIHSDTFGTAADRDERLEQLKTAIEEGDVESRSVNSDRVPFYHLRNDAGEILLEGLIDSAELDAVFVQVRNELGLGEDLDRDEFTEEQETAFSLALRHKLREPQNESLRLIGGDRAEFQFFIDGLRREEYDFQSIRNDYYVATHPTIFRHKTQREQMRDRLFNYVDDNTDQQLYTIFEPLVVKERAIFQLLIVDRHAAMDGIRRLWKSNNRFYGEDEAEAKAEAERVFAEHSLDIVQAAREYENYRFVEHAFDMDYEIELTVPGVVVNDEPLSFKYTRRLGNRDQAWQQADYLRQRARMYPIIRLGQREYAYFLYDPTTEDFGTDWQREQRRQAWNFNWEDRILWRSVAAYPSAEAALRAFRGSDDEEEEEANAGSPSFLRLIREKRHYGRLERGDLAGSKDNIGPFQLAIVDPGRVVATTPGTYRIVKDRREKFAEMESLLFREGFHVVEHILLRPEPLEPPETLTDSAMLNEQLIGYFDICPDVSPAELPVPPDRYLALTDPFSHWATVVLPFWPRRFQDMNFRGFFEETLRRETPAHVALRIVWVDPVDMEKFETLYRRWQVALATNTNGLPSYRNELMEHLLAMRNVYPEANLSSSEADTEKEGSLILDRTKLI